MKEPGCYKVEQPDGGDVQIMSLYPSSADTYRAAGWTVTPMSIVTTADLDALREAAKNWCDWYDAHLRFNFTLTPDQHERLAEQNRVTRAALALIGEER